MDIEGVLAIVFLFGGGTFAALSFSPIGRAVADRIRGKSSAADGGDLRAELAEELEQVRLQVGDLAERVDFTERLLAKQREGERLAPPRGG